jgi:predicted membrane protein
MADNDPNKPPPDNYAENLGQRIRQNVHDQIDERMRYRQERWQAKMDRRRERWTGRGMGPMGGVGLHGASGGLIIGLILAGIGAVLLLQNFGIFPNQDLWDFWPIILIIAGIARAATAFSVTGRMWGGLVALGGLLFLAANFGFIHHNLWELFWPVILILAGGVMLVRGLERNHYLDQWRSGGAAGMAGGPSRGAPGSPTGTADPRAMNMVHEFAIFGGGHRRIDSKEFEGGDIVALFGGVQLDLREAETKLPELNIDVTAAFGGAEIRVPETWAVSMRVTSIFGGYDDKTHVPPPGAAKPPTLVITGAVIFGGLAVKN